MKLFERRLFIKDLPPNLTENDIKEKFSNFGDVISVEIKLRKNITEKNQELRYAFVKLHANNCQLQQCFQDIPKDIWKGNYVEIETAKESFLERLKKEREDATSIKSCTRKDNMENFYKSDLESIEKLGVPVPNQNFHDHVPKKRKLINDGTVSPQDLKSSLYDRDIVQLNCFDNKNLNEHMSGKKNNLSDEKRINSIIEMRNNYRKQKDAIRTALMKVDIKVNNTTTFHENDNHTHVIQESLTQRCDDKSNQLGSHKKFLFEDDEEEDHSRYNFEVKREFQGKSGKKLMELQLKFKNDKRFMMDERFLEADDKLVNEENEIDNDGAVDLISITQDDEITVAEKQKEWSILEDILEEKVYKEKDKEVGRRAIKPISMTRYDPTKGEHQKYIVLQENEQIKKKRNEKENHDTYLQETEKPVVSKETFYEVENNLKDVLEKNAPFSLLNLFHPHVESDNIPNNNIDSETQIKEDNLFQNNDKNIFKFDSSDESDCEKGDSVKKYIAKEGDNKSQKISLSSKRVWIESFFFRNDDYRLQEGVDFIRKFNVDDKPEFQQTRRNIKGIVRAKIRNNKKKNKLYKKKLGGRRMINIKKALKNR